MEQFGAGTLTEIRKEAAAWLIEMDAEPEHWDRSGFVAWLKLSPRHMEEFLEYSMLWAGLHDQPRGMDDDLRKLLEDSRKNVVDWPNNAQKRDQSPRPRRTRVWSWFPRFAAVCVVIFAFSFVSRLLQDNPRILTTAIGEQRAVQLIDHSVVHLNTDTQVEVRFTDSARQVRLIRGEALFSVERDTHRPFRVRSNDIHVEALGTQFNINRRTADTVISVIEGRVAVARSFATVSPAVGGSKPSRGNIAIESHDGGVPTTVPQQRGVKAAGVPPNVLSEAGRTASASALAVVGAGEQVRVSSDGMVEQEAIGDIMLATAWRQRRLVFANTPLADVAAEVARYNVVPQLQIEGSALKSRRLTGVFAADDPESLILFLERDPALFVVRDGDTVIIRSREW